MSKLDPRKLSVNVTPEVDRIISAEQERGIPITHVVDRGVTLYGFAKDAQREGKELLVRDTDGSISVIHLL